MPENYYEFVALCEYIAQDMYPFGAAGFQNYQNFVCQAIMLQLLGKQQLETWLNYDGGDYEIVTGISNEPLFPGLDTTKAMIYKPITKVISLTEENGYYGYQSAAEYYAIAIGQMIFDYEWMAPASKNSNYDQKTAMSDFMMSGYEPAITEQAMFIEMDFWYNEAKIGNIPQYYDRKINHDGHEPRKLKWMSLPTVWEGYTDEQISDETKTRQILYGSNLNGLGIAAYVQKNPEIYAACKDFVKFYCSDYQMNRWTAEIGIRKVANYKITDETLEKLPYFNQKLGELLNTNMDVVFHYANNQTFLQNADDFVVGYHGCFMRHYIGSSRYYPITYFNHGIKTHTVKKLFEAGVLTPENWLGKYYGEFANLSEKEKLEKFAYQKDADGNEIKYVSNPNIA